MKTSFFFKFLQCLCHIFLLLMLSRPARCEHGQISVASSANLKLKFFSINIAEREQAAILPLDQLRESRNDHSAIGSASSDFSAPSLASETPNFGKVKIQQQSNSAKISLHDSDPRFSQPSSKRHLRDSPKSTTTRILAIDLAKITSSLEISPISPASQIVSTEFSGIGLYHDVPSNFTIGENFRFRGIVTDPTTLFTSALTSITTYNQVTIRLSSSAAGSEIRCAQSLAQGQYEFDINCFIGNKTGTFYLSVFAGKVGLPSFKLRNILPNTGNLPKMREAPLPMGLGLDVVDNRLVVSWSSLAPISKLVLSQNLPNGIISVQYLLSNFHTFFSVPFADFEGFKAQQTSVGLSHASAAGLSYYTIDSDFSIVSTFNFMAIEHKFATQNALSNISPPIPWRMAVGQKFTLQGSISSAINSDVFLVSPTLAITKVRIDNSPIISAGMPLKFDISFSVPGAHLLEINADTGEAVINRPIYVGDVYPLLPDFRDVQIGISQTLAQDLAALEQLLSSQTGQNITEPLPVADLQTKRDYLLRLTNFLRQKYSQGALYLDNSLNALAQAHSDDMRNLNYFSHVNLMGQDPGQRAQNMGFLSTIGENIATAYTLTEAHLQLERSASHLENSVNPIWTRVGIGISQALNGQIYVTYDFSSRDLLQYPLTAAEVQADQQQLVAIALQANPSLRSEDKALSQIVGDWMQTDRSTALFAYINSRVGARRSMAASIIRVTYRSDWLDTVRSDTSFISNFTGYARVSVGVALVNLELIEAYIVFS